jgi:hypothetical protein
VRGPLSTTLHPTATALPPRRSAMAGVIVRHPIGAFLVGAYGVGGPLLTVITTGSLPRG